MIMVEVRACVCISPVARIAAHAAPVGEPHLERSTDLWTCLVALPDPRDRRGVRHALTGVLAVAVCAVLAGARSFTAIGEWAADASPQVLAASPSLRRVAALPFPPAIHLVERNRRGVRASRGMVSCRALPAGC